VAPLVWIVHLAAGACPAAWVSGLVAVPIRRALPILRALELLLPLTADTGSAPAGLCLVQRGQDVERAALALAGKLQAPVAAAAAAQLTQAAAAVQVPAALGRLLGQHWLPPGQSAASDRS
jgi:hypothetical protein